MMTGSLLTCKQKLAVSNLGREVRNLFTTCKATTLTPFSRLLLVMIVNLQTSHELQTLIHDQYMTTLKSLLRTPPKPSRRQTHTGRLATQFPHGSQGCLHELFKATTIVNPYLCKTCHRPFFLIS